MGAHGLVIYHLRQGIHVAVKIHEDVGPAAFSENVALIGKGLDKRLGIIALPPGLCDLLHPLLFADTRFSFLFFFIQGDLAFAGSFLPVITIRQR